MGRCGAEEAVVEEGEMKLTKVTEFVGRACGDGECFCFDKLTEAERDSLDETIAALEEWPDGFDPNKERVYPSDFLPDVDRDRRGRWRITVEFEPVDDT